MQTVFHAEIGNSWFLAFHALLHIRMEVPVHRFHAVKEVPVVLQLPEPVKRHHLKHQDRIFPAFYPEFIVYGGE